MTISDCTGDTDDDGITLKSTGPAACENVVISNCIVSSHCNALKCGTESTGGFRNRAISNCVVKPSAQKTKINGTPEGLAAISLNGVRIELASAGEAGDVGKAVPEKERAYPEGRMWGRLPACGFFIRHAARVRFSDVTVVPAAGEPRPPLVTADITDSVGLSGA